MDQSWWSTKIPGKSILINMKIKIELYGASKDLSSENIIELKLKNNSHIKDLRNELIKFIDNKHKLYFIKINSKSIFRDFNTQRDFLIK